MDTTSRVPGTVDDRADAVDDREDAVTAVDDREHVATTVDARPELEDGSTPSSRTLATVRWIPPVAAVGACVIAAVALTGWILRVEIMASVIPGQMTMKANTVAGFLLLSAALWGAHRARRPWVSSVSAAGAAAVGAVTLVRYAWGLELGADELVIDEWMRAAGTIDAGRMAPNAALGFVLLGGALLALDAPGFRRVHPAPTAALVTGSMALLALLGYSSGVMSLYAVPVAVRMAAPTALAFLLLSAGVLCLRPHRGAMAFVLASDSAGVTIRWLLPVAAAAPVVLSALQLSGQGLGLYGAREGFWLFAASLTMLITAVGWQLARSLRRAEHDRRRVERDLADARDAAVQASQVKSQFLANVSHEIRTPMNGVLGMIDLLDDTDLDAEQRRYVQMARTSGETLLALINDVLDLSKIEAGELRIEWIDFNLRELVGDVSSLMAQRAREKGIDFSFEFADGTTEFVRGDPTRTRQILSNLVSNAVKFTHEGKVGVRVCSEPRVDGDGVVAVVEVSDTGIGIAGEQLREMFAPFRQADSSTARRFGGTGLGLAISAQLVEAMDGRIDADSTPGEGSTFRVELHYQHPAGPATTERGGSAGHGGPPRIAGSPRVLLAEDNSVNQFLAARLLEQRGCRVDLVADGHAAVEAAATAPYAAIFMDCQMPGMDGFEATARIRQLDDAAGGVPIIAMTANAMRGDRERCLAAGMDDYVSKPIRQRHVDAALTRWLVERGGNGDGPAPPDAAASPRSPGSMVRDTDAPLRRAAVDDGAPTDASGNGQTAEPVVDSAAVASLVSEIGEGTVVRLLGTFRERTPELLARLDAAVATGDAEGAAIAAHTLKGSSASMGAARLAAAAAELERLARAGALAQGPAIVDRLDSLWDDTLDALADALQAIADARLVRHDDPRGEIHDDLGAG